jgi:translation initiation factor IF-1
MFLHGRTLQADGTILKVLAGGNFRVRLDDGGRVVVCRTNFTIKNNRIPLVERDRVLVELPVTTGEMNRGRIVFRYFEARADTL